MNTIKIGKNEYNVKYTIRALFVFEQITKKAFKIETLLDNYIFFYSLILASNPDKVLDWDEFVDALDEDTTLFARLSDIVDKQQKEEKIFDDGNDDGGEQKKS